MPFDFCLTQPDGSEWCFDIPVLVQQFPFGPDPDPTLLVRGPVPDPWIRAQGITPEIARTLASMATVLEVAERLDGELSAMMGNMFMEQIKRMRLPAGANIKIRGRAGT